MTEKPNDIRAWHRRACRVTPWLYVSGDLPHDPEAARLQLAEWASLGVTDIVDVRGEWSDEDFVAEHAPDIRYHYWGTHDNGGLQTDDWFYNGMRLVRTLRKNEAEPVFMVHCHMGINRGPSMAFAMMLETGVAPVDALTQIRAARPIAAIAYAEDALRAYHRRCKISPSLQVLQRSQLRGWQQDNQIDTSTIIRLIRTAS